MPLYEFECTSCGNKDQRYFTSWKTAPRESECSKCGNKSDRLLSRGNYKVKSRGWKYDQTKDKAVPRDIDD